MGVAARTPECDQTCLGRGGGFVRNVAPWPNSIYAALIFSRDSSRCLTDTVEKGLVIAVGM